MPYVARRRATAASQRRPAPDGTTARRHDGWSVTHDVRIGEQPSAGRAKLGCLLAEIEGVLFGDARAAARLRAVVDRYYEYAPAWVRYARVLQALEQPRAALEAAQSAVCCAPDDPATMCELAGCLQTLGRHEEALAVLATAQALPAVRKAPIFARQATVLKELGRTAEAAALFARALDCEPLHAPRGLGARTCPKRSLRVPSRAINYKQFGANRARRSKFKERLRLYKSPRASAVLLAMCLNDGSHFPEFSESKRAADWQRDAYLCWNSRRHRCVHVALYRRPHVSGRVLGCHQRTVWVPRPTCRRKSYCNTRSGLETRRRFPPRRERLSPGSNSAYRRRPLPCPRGIRSVFKLSLTFREMIRSP